MVQNYEVRRQKPRVAEQCNVNIHLLAHSTLNGVKHHSYQAIGGAEVSAAAGCAATLRNITELRLNQMGTDTRARCAVATLAGQLAPSGCRSLPEEEAWPIRA
ncbi:hypothetical protein TNCV_4589751 [Trichonephila clavipes]|nr:hypothetical protein TNCV_4589751 [Trichonephila clavipes]